ncbi:uncharacterized protein [Nicotiana sylvestris]|uniref:uncharacterized protein n=1 Tax=Nicotiana sylvestris TaxID=4096 RepID=UPI00388C5167
MVQGSKKWHEKLSFALLGYRTIVRTSVGATPYLLVYGTEAVIPAEVETPSLRIVVEANIDDDEWVKTRLEQVSLIDEKRLTAVCMVNYIRKNGKSIQQKGASPKIRSEPDGIETHPSHQVEPKGKFVPNWQGSFVVTRVLPNSALYLTDIEDKCVDMTINSDAVKRGKKFCLESSKKRAWLMTLMDNEI